MLIVAIRGFTAAFISAYSAHPTIPIYFGSFYQMMNASPVHIESLFFLWSTNYLATILVVGLFKLKDFTWLEIIRFFEDQVPAKAIGLTKAEGATLKGHARHILMSVHLQSWTVTISALALFIIFCFTKYYPHFDYLFFNFIWFFLYLNYISQMTFMIYINAAFLFIICWMIRMKIHRLVEYLDGFEQYKRLLRQQDGKQSIPGNLPSTGTNSAAEAKMKRKSARSATVDMIVATKYLNRLLRENGHYNAFWSPLFSIALGWRLWIINVILYVVLFYPLSGHFLFIYRLIAVAEVGSFFAIVHQASLIPIDAQKLGKHLRLFIDHHQVKSLSIRLKVC